MVGCSAVSRSIPAVSSEGELHVTNICAIGLLLFLSKDAGSIPGHGGRFTDNSGESANARVFKILAHAADFQVAKVNREPSTMVHFTTCVALAS